MRQEADTSSRALRGLRVAVTRPRGQEESLRAALAAEGAEVLHHPLIRVEAPTDPAPLRDAAARTSEFHWLVFTSANAVHRFSEALKAASVSVANLARVRIAAVGPATRAALEAHGFHVDLLPGEALAEAVVDAMAEATDLKGVRVLWPCALEASTELMQGLTRLGAVVHAVEAYRTVADSDAGVALAREVAAGRVDVLTFTSPSAVRAFTGSGGRSAASAIVAVIGPVTAAQARAHGLPVHLEAMPHTVAGLVAALRGYYE